MRSGNEDGFFASREEAVFAVADGMGGHQHGEVASHLALEAIARHAATLSNASPTELANDLYLALQEANQSILSQAEAQDARSRMGTTIVLTTICGDRLYFAHIGDSRLYLLRGDAFTQLTRDHSLVQAMVDRGEISPEEAAIHPLRHQITRVVGGDDRISPEIASQALEPGDLILLCTDGLSGAVSADQLRTILRDTGAAQDKAEALVQAALNAGGPDNITAVVISYQCPRPIPKQPVTIQTSHRQLPRWLTILLVIFGIGLLLSAGAYWSYRHPAYVVSVDAGETLHLYKEWPLLPLLSRELAPTPEVIPITLMEARPYYSSFPTEMREQQLTIPVQSRDAGVAVLNAIVSSAASGLLAEAKTSLEKGNITAATIALDRAKALHADLQMIKQLEAQLQLKRNHHRRNNTDAGRVRVVLFHPHTPPTSLA